MTPTRVVSKCDASAPTVHPGSALIRSRMRRRVAFPRASKTLAMSRSAFM